MTCNSLTIVATFYYFQLMHDKIVILIPPRHLWTMQHILLLVYIRSVNKGTFKVSGFVLPRREAIGKIVLATVEWDKKHHQFVGSLTVISKEKFLDSLDEVIKSQQHFNGIPSEATYFSDCLSQSLS